MDMQVNELGGHRMDGVVARSRFAWQRCRRHFKGSPSIGREEPSRSAIRPQTRDGPNPNWTLGWGDLRTWRVVEGSNVGPNLGTFAYAAMCLVGA